MIDISFAQSTSTLLWDSEFEDPMDKFLESVFLQRKISQIVRALSNKCF